MKASDQNQIIDLAIATADGTFVARYSAKGLAGLDFPARRKRVASAAKAAAPPQIRRWHCITVAALKRALTGRAPQALPPLDLSSGTEFQQQVWNAMRRIACGKTSSYGEIAHAIGNPKAVRAVGGACGANPVPVLVPCHRVLAANGKIGGFFGGLDWKLKLLEREGVNLD